MKNFSLSAVLDALFYSFISFAVCFFGLLKPLGRISALCLSTFITLVVFTFFIFRNVKKVKKISLTKKEQKKAKRFNEFLCILNKKDGFNIVTHALQKAYPTGEVDKFSFVVPHKNLRIFFFFSFDGLTKSNVVFAYNRLLPNETAVIYAYNEPADVIEFSKRFSGKIEIKNGEKLYALVKDFLPLSVLPRTTFSENKKIGNFFSKKSAKKLFLFGALFLLTSSLVTFKTYYIVFGTIFLICSAISYFFGKPA